jgi:hypothetical protein
MSERIRGLEVTIRLSIEGELQGGTLIKFSDFSITPRAEVTESDFLGEDESDIDFRHDGFDFSGTAHELDATARAFLALLVFNHENHIAPPNVTMTVIFGYRDGRPVSETYYGAKMKVDETSFGSRKDYVTTKISGKCKKYSAATALTA